MRYWWVNQNQTYKAEVRGSFMWSPKQNANGARNQFYENMREVSLGDIVFSFCDTRIKSIGIVTGTAQTGPKPDFGAAGANWSREGWFVPVDYCKLDTQIRPKDHAAILRPFLPSKYSPLQENGDGLQSVYLAEVPATLAEALIGLIGPKYWDAYSTITALQSPPEMALPDNVIADAGITGPTFREQLVRARRGQGVFRSNVLLREDSCRVTRVNEPRHLKASHIKPWRDATDAERLDGANGLLLSPHIDHLFDEGYITFSSSQELVIVPEVRDKLLDAWGIDAGVRVGEFTREQNAYLDYHRVSVFKRDLLTR
ncbi:MAG TPA: HNH endonuclease signature motif containing protein [Vicinamibacterales bacterium]|nr:HNH endonuclease signature motif containing protein [Vicinamibacterales bacterium]